MSHRQDEHEALLAEGLRYYDGFEYGRALPLLAKAHEIAPACVGALYNYANVLHMIGRAEEAEALLQTIISTPIEEFEFACPSIDVESVAIDAHYLLFHVIIYGLGFSREAFSHAYRHLELRGEDIESVWTREHVESEVADFEKEWRGQNQ